uniref:Uncharacterized protein n=1 Tax=Daphnia galeata TaxID=27404 RepID=A0A8J2S1K3_9CRUS|nr:unnamed protein product [Daphnia galeata]
MTLGVNNAVRFLCLTTDRAGVGILRQGLVAISSNENCKQDTIFGKFVSDNSTCVTSPTNNKFTCVVKCNSNGLKTRVSAYRDWIDRAN